MSDFHDNRRDTKYDEKLAKIPDLFNKYWFLGKNDEGLHFNFRKSNDGQEFKPNTVVYQFFNKLFEADFYIKGLFKHRKLLSAVFDSHLSLDDIHIVGDDILPIRTKQLEWYKPPKVSHDGREAHYEFTPMQMLDKGRTLNLLNEDIFLAQLWKNQVRYGFDFQSIVKGIKYNRLEIKLGNTLLPIAKSRLPVPPVHATRDDVSDKLQVDTRADIEEDDQNGQVDMYRFKNTIYHVNAGEVLYKKYPAEKGKQGRDVFGNSIPAEEPQDNVDMQALSGDGTEVKQIDGVESLVTARNGTLDVESSGRISVNLGIVVKRVDLSTGNLEINMPHEEMVIQEEIEEARKVTLDIRQLTVKGRVYGTIEVYGQTNVFLEDGMTKGKIIHHGSGQIMVKGKITISEIQAKESQVALEQLEKSTVAAKMIKIKHFLHSLCWGRAIKIAEVANTKSGKGYILGEMIEVKTISGGGEAGLTCVWRQDKKKVVQEAPAQGMNYEKAKALHANALKQLKNHLAENKKLIDIYQNIEKLINKPGISAEQKQKLFMQKRVIFSKVIKPKSDLEEQVRQLESQMQKLSQSKPAPAPRKSPLKNYQLKVHDAPFEGDLFLNTYEMDSEFKNLFSMDAERLEALAKIKTIPAGAEGERFHRIQADAFPVMWNAQSHVERMKKSEQTE